MKHVNYPSHATSLLGLASYSSDYQRGYGLAQGWLPDTGRTAALNAKAGFKTRQGYLIKSPNPKGSFQCAIPMKNIFSFMDDYSKGTYGMRDTLQLIRKDDDDAMSRIAAADVGKVKLTKLARSVPIVQPNDARNSTYK